MRLYEADKSNRLFTKPKRIRNAYSAWWSRRLSGAPINQTKPKKPVGNSAKDMRILYISRLSVENILG